SIAKIRCSRPTAITISLSGSRTAITTAPPAKTNNAEISISTPPINDDMNDAENSPYPGSFHVKLYDWLYRIDCEDIRRVDKVKPQGEA
ncbi:MAG: hypothetical protein JHC33_08550, partial [Ignisphaera sp.]|nr:hypothetical protein [Ignisphaera sp.]